MAKKVHPTDMDQMFHQNPGSSSNSSSGEGETSTALGDVKQKMHAHLEATRLVQESQDVVTMIREIKERLGKALEEGKQPSREDLQEFDSKLDVVAVAADSRIGKLKEMIPPPAGVAYGAQVAAALGTDERREVRVGAKRLKISESEYRLRHQFDKLPPAPALAPSLLPVASVVAVVAAAASEKPSAGMERARQTVLDCKIPPPTDGTCYGPRETIQLVTTLVPKGKRTGVIKLWIETGLIPVKFNQVEKYLTMFHKKGLAGVPKEYGRPGRPRAIPNDILMSALDDFSNQNSGKIVGRKEVADFIMEHRRRIALEQGQQVDQEELRPSRATISCTLNILAATTNSGTIEQSQSKGGRPRKIK